MNTRAMRVRLSLIACFISLGAFVPTDVSEAGPQDLRRIVVFQDGTATQVQEGVVRQSGSRLVRMLPLINGVSIELPAASADAALAFLRSHSNVVGVFADPVIRAHGLAPHGAGGDGAGGDGAGGDGAGGDHIVFVTPVAAPTAEQYPWGIDRIGAAAVHRADDHAVLGKPVTIAVFDTGIDRKHPDLAGNLAGGLNAIAGADPDDYDDDNGHGTAMAGIIAARRNNRGVIGAAPRARLYAVKVLDKNGQGLTSDTIYALGVIASERSIRLINMSYGTSIDWPLFPLAVRRALEKGKIIVTSRGNLCTSGTGAAGAGGDGAGGDGAGGDGAGGDGAGGDGAGGDAGCTRNATKYPAAYPEVITVGATTYTDQIAAYSLAECGNMLCVDIVAPGGGGAFKILSTNRGGGYGVIAGTSPATAHVTGVLALALEVDSDIAFDKLVHVMQRTARPLTCPACDPSRQGAGLIDAAAILDNLKD